MLSYLVCKQHAFLNALLSSEPENVSETLIKGNKKTHNTNALTGLSLSEVYLERHLLADPLGFLGSQQGCNFS